MPQNQHNTPFPKRAQLKLLLSQIEQKLNWGPSETWKGVDFERLSDLIFEQSNKRLSVTTLKRTWGRTSQLVKPSTTTLDILSQFVNAKSWREFTKSQEELNVNMDFEEPAQGSKLNYLTYGSGLIIVGLLTLFMSYEHPPSVQIIAPMDFSKSIKLDIHKVTNGIPNTVVFKYNIGDLEVDTLELQQSWDERKRVLLDPADSIVTTTYFSPGYFNAKLVADDKIIINKNLYLPSDGLQVLAFLEGEENPRLLPIDHWHVMAEELMFKPSYENAFDGKTKQSTLIVNLLDEPQTAADTFSFRTSLRIANDNEGDPCHPISIIITGKEDVYMFQLGHPGCSGKFSSYLGGDYVDGKNQDLSAMGFLEAKWADIDVSKNGEKVTFQINEEEITLSDSAKSIGKIGGVRIYTAQQMGIRLLELQDKHQVINLLNPTTTSATD